jgi:DNA-binding GntR family transcriptional regulator
VQTLQPAERTAIRKSRKTKKEAGVVVARPRGHGSQIVYEQLRKSILELSLAPGSPLDEAGLSKQFDMSRTPVREALVRLSADGLVMTLPNRNTIVSSINFAGMPAYFEALTLMYRATTRLAALHRRPKHMVTIRRHQTVFAKAVAECDALAMIGSNRDFHIAIAEVGGNTYFTTFLTRLLDEGRRLSRLYYSSFADMLPNQYVLEHEQMVAAIEAGDPELCDRLGAEHAAQLVRQIQSYLTRNSINDITMSFHRPRI